MKKIILVILLIVPELIIAQPWQWAKQIGGPGIDRAYIGHIDFQHNIYLFGLYARPYAATNYNNCYIESDTLIGSNGSFIAKYNQNGNLLWVKNCISPFGIMTIRSFVFDTVNSVFYVTGIYNYSCNIDTANLSTTNNSAFLAKLDVNGNCLWAENVGANAFSTSAGTALTLDNNGNVYMAGVTNFTIIIDTSTVTPGSFLGKFDSNGNNLWAKTKFSYTGFQSQMWFQTLRYYDNNIYAAGFPYMASTSDTIRVDTISITNLQGNGYGLICMDNTNSSAKWLRIEGMPHTNPNSIANSLIDVDGNGNIDFVGTFYDSCFIQQDTLIANSGSNGNGLLIKYDLNGNLIYLNQLFAPSLINCIGVDVQNDGSTFITGSFGGQATFGSFNINSSTYQDLFIAKYDNNGNCIGVDHTGVGVGLSIASDESSVYMTGIFPAAPTISDSISIGSNTFTNYGWEDIVFAKHDMITGMHGEERMSNNTLVIYANPNKGSFKLKIPDDFKNEQKLVLSIFDSSGKLIRQQQLNMNDEHPKLDVFGEAKGNYNVTLSNGKKVYNGKMIVE